MTNGNLKKLGYKKCIKVIQEHYNAPGTSAKRLVKLFKGEGDKRQAIESEAYRIMQLRDRLDVNTRRCELCDVAHGMGYFVVARVDIHFQTTPNKTTRSDWKRWSIVSPTLCGKCEYKARSVIAQYNELIDLYKTMKKLNTAIKAASND